MEYKTLDQCDNGVAPKGRRSHQTLLLVEPRFPPRTGMEYAVPNRAAISMKKRQTNAVLYFWGRRAVAVSIRWLSANANH